MHFYAFGRPFSSSRAQLYIIKVDFSISLSIVLLAANEHMRTLRLKKLKFLFTFQK